MAARTHVLALDETPRLSPMPPTKVLFCCTGVGIFNRGIESFFREAFDGLRETEGLDLKLAKGAGESKADEPVLWNLPRTGKVAALLGRCLRRNAYVVEQLSSFPSLVRLLKQERPSLIFYSDSNLGFQLFRWRKAIGVPFHLLFSNGGPCRPPFHRTDYVHQVAPLYLEEALAAGEPQEKHFLVPYGIHVGSPPDTSPAAKESARLKLGLPLHRPMVLSVGWISRQHKRMDYVIEELAKLPQPRPFLQLLGAMDETSPEIVALGNQLLGAENFSAVSVPYHQVADYYRAADIFTLASLKEGFGRVYLEALQYGLPVIAHRHSVIEYVTGDQGTLGDLSRAGELASLLQCHLHQPTDSPAAYERWQSVRNRFSWGMLAPDYRAMFQASAAPR